MTQLTITSHLFTDDGPSPLFTDDAATAHSVRTVGHTSAPIVALIPAYNEHRFIGSVVLAAQRYVDCVVVVDDGSHDDTAEIARRAGAIVLDHRGNHGKATAINTGFGYIRQMNPSAVVILDGDGQHDASDIPAVLSPVLEQEADIVVGSRFLDVKSDIPAYRQLGQHGLTISTNIASGVWVSDSQSGFRAFSPQALEQLSFSQAGFSVESEMQFQARKHNLRVAEMPIRVIYAEKAKRNPVSHGIQVVKGIITMMSQMRPLLYFGSVGLVQLVLGVLLGLHVVDILQKHGQLAVGYALVTVMLCLIGVLCLFTGLILHTLRSLFSEVRTKITQQLVVAETN